MGLAQVKARTRSACGYFRHTDFAGDKHESGLSGIVRGGPGVCAQRGTLGVLQSGERDPAACAEGLGTDPEGEGQLTPLELGSTEET